MSSFPRPGSAGGDAPAGRSASPIDTRPGPGPARMRTASGLLLSGWGGPISKRWRGVRSAALVLVATQIAVAGHVVGGGELPDLAALFAVAGLFAPVVHGLAKSRLRFVPVLGLMAGAQMLFHLLFALAAQHQMPMNLTAMFAFHSLAALVSAGLLSYGDRLVFELCAALQRLLRRVFRGRPAVDAPVRWTALVTVGAVRGRRSELATASGRRGPPQGF